jgi:hypothetical protein
MHDLHKPDESGGHQNRKNDHPPGWQTIWRAWHELQAMLCGADAMK